MALVLSGSNGVQDNSGAIVSGTAVTASGTSVDFTGIPAWAKRITVLLSGVSTSGSSPLLVQIGSGAIQNTGYVSNAFTSNVNNNSSTSGFILDAVRSAAIITNGIQTIAALGANVYVETGCTGGSNSLSGGNVTLSGTLDRVRITTVNGTDTFDAGTINIMWE